MSRHSAAASLCPQRAGLRPFCRRRYMSAPGMAVRPVQKNRAAFPLSVFQARRVCITFPVRRAFNRESAVPAPVSGCFSYIPSCPCIHRPLQYPHGDTAVWHMACESRRCDWVRAWFLPVAHRRMVVWCFLWGCSGNGYTKKAPSRFDLTLLCDSFSCTILPVMGGDSAGSLLRGKQVCLYNLIMDHD